MAEALARREVTELPPRRRRDDWEQSRTLLNMVRCLMSRPSGDEIAQHLVLNLLRVHQPKSAVISLFGVDGALHAVGAFGVTAKSLEVFKSMSLWDSSPMSDAIRQVDTVILRTTDEVTQRYPWLGIKGRPAEPLAAAPLALMNQQVGAIQITFAQPPDADTLTADLAGLTAVLALYLSLIRTNGGTAVRPGHVHAVDGFPPLGPTGGLALDGAGQPAPPASEPTSPLLSERQLEILRLMAKTMTNSQIAKRIGFSESTVRQETMAIYRQLEVHGRREAIRLASARGMLANDEAFASH